MQYAFQRGSLGSLTIRFDTPNSIHRVAVGRTLDNFDLPLNPDRLQKSQTSHLQATCLDVLRLLEHAGEKPALIDVGDLRIARDQRFLHYPPFESFPQGTVDLRIGNSDK